MDRRSVAASTPSTSSRPDEPSDLSPDEIFHILQTNRRRAVLDYLLDKDGPIKMSVIAEHVAADEHETTVAELTSAQRQRVYIPLYQSHLPKLDKKGIIEYDKPRGIVSPNDRIELFRPYLEASDSARPNASTDESSVESTVNRPHAIAIGTSVALLAASVGGLLALPELTLATSIVLLFALATLVTSLSKWRVSTNSDDTRLSH